MYCVSTIRVVNSCKLLFLLLFLPQISPKPRDHDQDTQFLNEIEEDVHSIPEIWLEAVLGGRAELPCDVNSNRRDDSVHMVLWFRDDFGFKPVYSLDVRGKPFSSARHWSSTLLFGTRAHFRTVSEPARLVIENVKLSDEGTYRCRIDFRNSPTQNFRFNLSIIEPVESVSMYDSSGRLLSTQLGPIQENKEFSVSCRVKGGRPSPPQIEFRLGGSQRLSASSKEPYRIEEDVYEKKLFPMVFSRNHLGANLTCSAFNSNLTEPLSETLTLNLHLRPLSVRIIQRDQLVANQRHEIICIATGSRPRAMITFWMGNERQLTDVTIVDDDELDGHSIDSDDFQNVTRSRLGFIPSIEDDGQRITCRAENVYIPHSALEDSWVLHIVYPPLVEVRLGSSLLKDSIKEGDDVFFDCIIKANPPKISLKWFLNDRPIQHNVSAGTILSNQSLVLQLVSRSNAGNYTCKAMNSIGTSVSNVFPLRVKFSPVCKQEKNVIVGVSKGERVSIKCELDADPSEINFRWDLATSGQMIGVAPSRFSVSGTTSLLHYAPVSNLDYGTLYCRGSSVIGMQASPCTFLIVLAEKPSPVNNCTVFNETTDSVELSCEEGPDGGLSQYFVLELFDGESNELRYNASSTMPFFHLSNLTPSGAGFRVLLYSVNPKGRSEPYRIDGLIQQTEKYAGMVESVLPSEYSWISFALSVAIGGTAVFLCVGSIVLVKTLHFRSRQHKRRSEAKNCKKHSNQNHHHNCDDSLDKNSLGNIVGNERGLDKDSGLSTGTGGDDKDEPDIIPSNIGPEAQQILIANHPNHFDFGPGGYGRDRKNRLNNQQPQPSTYYEANNVAYPVVDLVDPLSNHGQNHYLQQQQPYGDIRDPRSFHQLQNVQQNHQNFINHQQQRIGLQQQHFEQQTSLNELDNFSNLHSNRHSNNIANNINITNPNIPLQHPPEQQQQHPDPAYYDPKMMKHKLLSNNVPESCV